ncbi:MAG: DNA primase [Gammaproteobacteria bacterium]|nr:DNA primase [Gammaproteobacteria bacterium]
MAGSIPQHFIDEILARADIVDIVGSRVQLRKAGKEYKACCPFHDEKTPSFTVSPDKQFYHCFGCGENGTALGFLMAYDHLGFVEAIEELAQRMGMQVPRDERASRQQSQMKPLHETMENIAQYYQEQLKQDEAAKSYLKARGLTGKIAADYRVGSVANAWDSVMTRFGKNDSDKSRLKTLGMLSENDKGKVYDRFRGRIMFPIRDSRGRIVGFGGRVLQNDDKGAKYLNSPETPLFHKSKELYGLYEAKQANRHLERIVVVEGYMDVIALAQHGVSYAVATMGTATTTEHVQILFRTCDKVIFCFDGDRAGRKAAWKALENALPVLREGRALMFLFLPDGHDPDSFVREFGQTRFEQELDKATPLSEFLFGHLSEDLNMDHLDARASLAERAKPLINKIPQGVYRDLMLGRLAELVGTDVKQLQQRLIKPNGKSTNSRPSQRGGTKSAGRSDQRGGLVRQALSYLLQYPALAQHFDHIESLSEDQPGVKMLVNVLEVLHAEPDLNTPALLERFREHPHASALNKLVTRELILETEDAARAEFEDLMHKLSIKQSHEKRLEELLAKSRNSGLDQQEKLELASLLSERP